MDGIRRAEISCSDEVMGRTSVLATETTPGQMPEPLHHMRLQLERSSPAQAGTHPNPNLSALQAPSTDRGRLQPRSSRLCIKSSERLKDLYTNRSRMGTTHRTSRAQSRSSAPQGATEQEGQSIRGKAGGASSKVLTVRGLQVTTAQAQEAGELSTPPPCLSNLCPRTAAGI